MVVTVFGKSTKESINTTLTSLSELVKVTWYKVNIQTSVVFL